MKVIPIAEPLIGNKELKNVIKAVRSGWISSKGKFIPEFEEKFAKLADGSVDLKRLCAIPR